MSKFDLSKLLNEESNKQSIAFKIEHIAIDKLQPSLMNKYNVDDIAELKTSIELVGLQQNLVVRMKPDGVYEVISGHRRLKAMQELLASGDEQFAKVPCKIIKLSDDIQAELQLLLANSTARELTDYEKTYQAARLQEILKQLESSGFKFTGRKREIVAQLLNVSSAQVQRMDSINKKLIPELKEEFKDGNLNVTAAYEMSRLPEQQQQEVLQESSVENKPITPAVVKEKREKVLESEQKEKPITHEISLQNNLFDAIEKGIKTFVHCFNAWEYRVNDKLKINEVNELEWTGRYIEARITFILELENEFVVMSIKRLR